MPNRWRAETGHFCHIYREQQNPQGHQSRWPVNTVTPGERDPAKRESWDLHSYVIGDVVNDRSLIRDENYRTYTKRLQEASRFIPESLRALLHVAVTSVNSLRCRGSTCFRIGSKFRCIRSTPTEMQSTSKNDFECLASAGTKALVLDKLPILR